jgi:LPXTG-motif cell wall-anchored protein
MTLQHVSRATVLVFAFGVVTVGPATAQQRRDGSLLPQESSGQVTAVGCLVRGSSLRGGKQDKLALAHPKRGPVANVAEATCTADAGADALILDNPEKAGVTEAMLGRWVEIGGRLERETDKDPDNLRELDVASAKLVPVVPPRATAAPSPPAVAAARPAPRVEPAPAPETPPPAPAATLEARVLPKTASDVPAIGLAGLLLLASGLALRSLRRRDSARAFSRR